MLFFLRKVRKKLMKENKITSYLLYAIGEIVLVVVGILIAVRIDHWNDERKERKKEAFLVAEIHAEMKDNLAQFNSISNSIGSVIEEGSNLVDMFPLSPEIIQTQEFGQSFIDFRQNPSFDPFLGTLKSIINSGNIDLIENDELRKLIVSYEDVYRDYKEEESIAWNYGYEIMDWMSDHFPNPKHVPTNWEKIDLIGLQSRIGGKKDLYEWPYSGHDGAKLKAHMEQIIKLTESK